LIYEAAEKGGTFQACRLLAVLQESYDAYVVINSEVLFAPKHAPENMVSRRAQ
jgi:hypothetical protein